MARSSAKLRVVADPEDEMKALFIEEAQLKVELAGIQFRIASARMRYAVQHRLAALPRTELLRTRLLDGEAR